MSRALLPDDRARRFEQVFAEVYEPLRRHAQRRIDASLAQDVVAETLLVLWRRLDQVPEGSELPWCYGVARRCLANARRSNRRGLRLIERVAGQADTTTAVLDPSSGADDSHITEALARLSVDDQEILQLWAWEGLEPRDIAVVLGVSANAVSIRLHRAKRRLRARLDNGKELLATGHEGFGREEDTQ